MARSGIEIAKALVTLGLVLGATVVTLSGLDHLPAWMQGQPRGVRRLASIEEAERRLKARLFLPAYFPDTLRWPPSAVRYVGGDPSSVALLFDGSSGGLELVFAQTAGGSGPISPRVFPEASVLQRFPLAVGEGEGWLERVVGDDGAVWNEVTWLQRGERLALRGKGSVEQLIRMARSTRREGP